MNKITSLHSGCLLIAKPFLGDSNFERTVVFVCEHNEEGSFGLILNQSTPFMLNDALEESFYSDMPLRIGGPVGRNTLHFLHRLENKISNSIEVLPNLYWSGNFEEVKTLLRLGSITTEDMQFFVGYSGWSAQQLQHEYDQDAWIVTDADADLVLHTAPDSMWREVLKRLGGEYKVMANMPIDPRMN
jgi:putative transcriptional regulator